VKITTVTVNRGAAYWAAINVEELDLDFLIGELFQYLRRNCRSSKDRHKQSGRYQKNGYVYWFVQN